MHVTREDLIKLLSEKSGFYQKHIKVVLKALDEVVLDCFDQATEDEDVTVQLLVGLKLGNKIIPERERKDPRTQADIICAAEPKPFSRYSEDFRNKLREQFEEKTK